MHILVIGAGAIGFQLSKQLSQDGHDITQIDTDPSRVKRVSEQLDIIVAEGNGTSLQDLRGLGIEQVDLVAAMTTNDEVNLLACRMAKKLGVQSAIARVRNPEFTAPDFIFSPQELGVDQFIHPEKETADAIVRLIRQSSATDLVEFAEGKLSCSACASITSPPCSTRLWPNWGGSWPTFPCASSPSSASSRP